MPPSNLRQPPVKPRHTIATLIAIATLSKMLVERGEIVADRDQ